MEINNGVAVVSGGASGLGEATVRYLLARGARAAILDFARDRGEKIAAELGQDVLFCQTDVTDGDSVQAAIAKTMETFGAVHFAVNCAGVAPGAKVLGKEGQPMDIVKFNQAVQINLIGTMNVIRLAAARMNRNTPNADGERGVVINTASIAAFEGQFGQAAYAASKAAVAGMTLPIAREFADYGIRIVTIAPGLFETPMMAGMPPKVYEGLINMTLFPKRLGKPVEFAMLAAQIIENPMLNGETIRLDGGIRMQAR